MTEIFEQTDRMSDFELIQNTLIAKDVYKMTLVGDARFITSPGQFVNVKIEGFFLRRPISVCDLEGDRLTLVYKVVGNGTDVMSRWQKGKKVNLLTGLGNGYDLSLAGERPVLIGGGVGCPPLYFLAKRLKSMGCDDISVALGFNSACDMILQEEFVALGCDVKVATVDGSAGVKGVVTDVVGRDRTHFYACGSPAMLRAVSTTLDIGGSVSMEARMGCGFGACMGCSLPTKNGTKRVCKEGPVFDAEEIIW